MKVIISSAGLGERLRPITDTIPKSIVKINGKSIIERIIRGFMNCGVNYFAIITGYLGEKIINEVDSLKLPVKVNFINNDYYNYHSCGYSMFLAADEFKDSETIFMEGDLVLQPDFYGLMSQRRVKNAVFVNKNIDPEKSVVVLGDGEYVKEFVYDKTHQNVFDLVSNKEEVRGESMQIWKFSKSASNFLSEELKTCLNQITKEKDTRTNLFPINKVIKKYPMRIIDNNGLEWFNINKVSDIEKAAQFFKTKDEYANA